MIVWLIGWFGFLPWMTHAFPSLVRSSEVAHVRFDDFSPFYFEGVIVSVYFDTPCIVATGMCTGLGRDSEYDVVVKLKHLPRCGCKKRVQFEGDNWPDKKISSEQCFLKSNKFPFNATVLARAIATGEIDLSWSGLPDEEFHVAH